MNELSKPQAGSLLRNLHGEVQLPNPYSQEIFLIRVLVAGTTHVAGIEELEPFLRSGDRLKLVRVPQNPSDPNAIKLYTGDGVKLGYVPQKDNQILARLMDAGKLLYALLADKQWKGSWLMLWADIYMQDD